MNRKSQSDPPSSSVDLLLTVPEVAQCLRVSVSTVRTWIFDRRIEHIKLGSSVRIRESVVKDLLAAGTVSAGRSGR